MVPASVAPDALVPDTTHKAAPHGRKPLPEAVVRLEVKTALEGEDIVFMTEGAFTPELTGRRRRTSTTCLWAWRRCGSACWGA